MATIIGNNRNNILSGTRSADTISGRGGNDVIDGRAGNDRISGDSGNDQILGGAGNDRIDGGSGLDLIDFSDATGGINFTLVQSSSNVTVNLASVGLGTDTYKNIEGVIGTNYNDTITGGSHDDKIYAGSGNDKVYGLGGNDWIDAGSGNDSVDGGDGNDTIYGGTGNDSLLGGSGKDWIDAGNDNDTVDGGAGNDTIYGGAGNDSLLGGSGKDRIDAGSGNDTVDGGAGNDTIYGGSGNDTINGGDGNDWIDAGSGDDSVVMLVTTDNVDTIDAGTGIDTLVLTGTVGGTGVLIADLSSTTDQVVSIGGVADARVQKNFENLDASGLGSSIYATGTSGADVITGSAGNDTLSGGAGNDTIFGGAGNDSLTGGSGADQLTGGSGQDRFIYQLATDSPAAGPLDSILDFTQGQDKIDLAAFRGANDLIWKGEDPAVPGPWEVWYHNDTTSTFVYADTSGDGIADVKIELKNSPGLNLLVTDFLGVVGAPVTDVNDAPVLTGDLAATVAEGTSYTITTTDLNFSDPDDTAAGVTFTVTDQVNGTVQVLGVDASSFTGTQLAAGGVTFLHNGSETLAASFKVSVEDGNEDSSTPIQSTFNLTVTPVNDAPVTVADTLAAMAEDSGARLITQAELLTNATDVDNTVLTATGLAISSGNGTLVDNLDGTWSYAPALNDDTAVSFSYSVTDGSLSAPGSATLDITPVNDAPVAVDDPLSSVAEDSGTRIISFASLTGNDSAGPANEAGQTLTETAVSNAVGGSVAIVGGQVQFTPTADFNGTASFDYTVQDNGQTNGADDFKTDTGSVSFAVTAVNDAPVSGGDAAASGNEDDALIFGAVPAAMDADGDPLTYALVDQAPAGVTFNNADGTFTVAPLAADQALDSGESRVVSFQYVAHDGTVSSAPATVTVTINGVNDAPAGNSAPVVAGTDVTGAVTELLTAAGNLTDSGTIAFTDVDVADIHSVSAVTPSSGALGTLTASVTITGTTDTGVGGVVTWNYSVAAADVEFLAQDQHQIESFTFDVLDGQGGSVSRTVSVDILGTNDAAVLSSATTDLDEADAPLSTGGTLAISDVDSEESFVEQTDTAGANGHFSIDGNGAWSYTANAAFDSLNVGDSLSDTFSVESIDGTQTSVTVTINGTNDAAVLSSATTDLDEADAPLSTGGTLAISDVDSEESFVEQTDTAGANGHFSIDGNGAWSYTANAAFDSLNVGDSLSDTFSVESIDGTQTSVTVTINGTNDAAVLSSATTDLDEADAPLSTGGTLAISDVDSEESFVEQTDTAGANGHFSIDGNGAWSYTANAAFDSLNVGDSLSDTFSVESIDGTQTSVTVTINGTNDAAVLSSATTDLDEADAPLSTGGTLAISDVDSEESFVEQTDTAGANGHFSIDGNGAWSYTANAAFDSLNVGDSLSDTFSVESIDGTQTSVTVTINGTNDAAVLSSATTDLDEADAPLSTGGTLAISDVDSEESFVEQTDTAGANGHFSIDGNGAWSYTANAAFDSLNVGDSLSDTFSVESIDGTQTSVTVTINGTNDAAVLSSATTDLDEADAPLSTGGTLAISDVDSEESFVEQTDTAGANGHFSIDGNGAWSYTANAAFDSLNVGDSLSDTFSVESIDGTQTSVTVTINGTNDAAVLSSATTDLDEADAPLSTGGTLAISDVDSEESFVEQTDTAGANGHFSIDGNGAWSYTANAAFDSLNVGDSLSDTFSVESIDGTQTSVTVTINGTNDAAVLSSATTDLDEADAPLSTGGTLAISDVDSEESFVEQTDTAGANGHFSIDGNGAWSYTANAAFDSLNVGDSLSDTFSVESIDGTQTSVTVTINGTNDAAVITGTATDAVIEAGGFNNGTPGDATAVGDLDATDIDSLATFVAQTNLATRFGHFSIDSSGAWSYTLDDSNRAVQALNTGDTPPDLITVETEDGTTHQIEVTINGADDELFDDNANIVDFSSVVAGSYGAETQYDALGGDDTVTLPDDPMAAELAGYELGHIFLGGAGNDTITGGGLNDFIDGGPGYDSINGGAGTDTVSYASVDSVDGVYLDLSLGFALDNTSGTTDTLISIENVTGSEFSDVLSGNDDANVLDGGVGDDIMEGFAGDDVMSGGAGGDTMYGEENNDILVGGDGDDYLDGGGGDDTLEGGAGDDQFIGGDGVDLLDFSHEMTGFLFTLDVGGSGFADVNGMDMYSEMEGVIGGSGDDILTGNAGNNILQGGGGNDTLDGGAGNDKLIGGGGGDIFDYNALSDADVGTAGDTISDFNKFEGDKLDLQDLLSSIGAPNDSTAFSGFLRFTDSGGDTLVQVNSNGDGADDSFQTLATITSVALTSAETDYFIL